jgi:hypothetical protein
MKNESGEKQRLTLQECKARIAEELNEHDFESARRHHDWESLLDKVAELYASQSLPIREKPDFLTFVIKAKNEICAKHGYSDWPNTLHNRSREFITNTYEELLERIRKDYIEPIR